ncbi:MAG: thioredoxin domain-containing protein [Bacteroidota bacterium]
MFKKSDFIIPFISSVILFSISITVVGCNGGMQNHAMVQDTGYGNLGPEEFQKGFSSGNAILLDVRTPEEIAAGGIPGASTIDFYDPEFETRINLMDKSKSIYVYCHAGGRSAKAAQLLINNGFAHVYNLQGGMTAWEEKGLPVEVSVQSKDENIRQMTLQEFNESLDSPLPVLVDFHTQWCAPCRQMAPLVDELEKEMQGKAMVLRMDVDKSKEVAKSFGIKGVPVFVLFKNGKEVARKTGAMGKSDLIQFISQ